METKSYEYNGKRYDFILSMRAKIEIEKAQKAKLKNPAVARLAMGAKDGIDSLSDEQLVEILPHMDELEDLSPLDIGFIVLSTYPIYRDEVTREFFDGLVDDMDVKLGVEAAYAFFVEVQQQVFTQLAAMQENQASKTESRENLKVVANKKK